MFFLLYVYGNTKVILRYVFWNVEINFMYRLWAHQMITVNIILVGYM